MTVIAITVGIMLLSGAAAWLLGNLTEGRLIAPRLTAQTVREGVLRRPRLRAMVRSRLDATSATGLALTGAVVVIVLGALGVGALLLMVRKNVGFATFDISAAKYGAHHASPVSTSFLRALSQFGGAVALIPLTLVVLAFAIRRRGQALSTAGFLVLAVGGQFAVANVVKMVVKRARPAIDQLSGFSGSSFPSGHAVAAAASLGAFVLVLGRGRSARTNVMLAAAAVGIAAGVAASRVFLGVHWLTDVIAGLALGWAWFALCSVAFGGRLLHFGAPAEKAEEVVEAVDSARDPSLPSSHVARKGTG
ncbi:MAG: hypothetical protein NVSMB57_04610 [Actinomycetota bacterium]